MKRCVSSFARGLGLGVVLLGSSLSCDGTPSGGQVDTTSTITMNSTGTLVVADTVGALKSIPSTSLRSTTVYVLRGYYALGDTLEGTLAWAPQSAATADDIFVFKPNCVGSGRGRFIRVEGGTFDARKGGLKMDGTAAQGARLAAIYTASNNYTGLSGAGGATGAVIDQLWLGPGTLNISDGVTLTAGTAKAGASKSIAIAGAGQLATTIVGSPRGTFAQRMKVWSALAEVQNDDSPGYGVHTWTQDLSEGASGGGGPLAGGGTYTFPGVSSAGDFVAGDWVFVRLGVDPIDQNLPFETLLTQVTAVSGNDITVATPVHEAIPLVTSTAARTWNKHDLIKITALFNGFELSDLSLDNVLVDVKMTIGTHVHDVDVAYGTGTFLASFDENTVLERLTVDRITGAPNVVSPYYGWFYQGALHRNTVIRDLNVHLLDGVPFFAALGQSRGMAIENASVNMDSRTSPIGAIAFSLSGSGVVQFTNLALTGNGNATFAGTTVDGLSVMGSLSLPGNPNLDLMILGSEITDYLFFNGKRFDEIQTATTMTVPLTPSSDIVVPYPLKGVPRHVRIRPSTLTGVQVAQQASNITTSITDSLVAGQFTEPRTCTLLGVNFPAGGLSESQRLIISTDATVPPGSYVEIQSEFWTSSSEENIQPPVQQVGAGPPTVSADFISQRYYDAVGTVYYQAVRSGLGSSDWVLAAN